jgi:hypothetical protein
MGQRGGSLREPGLRVDLIGAARILGAEPLGHPPRMGPGAFAAHPQGAAVSGPIAVEREAAPLQGVERPLRGRA